MKMIKSPRQFPASFIKDRSLERLPIEHFDYEQKLAGNPLLHEFSEECAFLHQNGYVVLEDAVNEDLCQELSDLYSTISDGNFDGKLFCEYFDQASVRHYGVEYSPSAVMASERKFKILDLFSTNKLALAAAFSPKIEKFLSLIFNSDLLAFQQLGFLYGTEQPIHQDTAYVRVSKPAMLAASWIALEDIAEGTGELEFIPGSHKYDSFRFNSSNDKWCQLIEPFPERSVWWDNVDDNAHRDFLSRLQSLKPSFGYGKFLPKKGDALIWISFFAHGGSPIAWDEPDKANRSRKSLVTHYCPYPETAPMYSYEVAHNSTLQYGKNSYYISKRYPLSGLPEGFNHEKYLKMHKDVAMNDRYSHDPGLHYIMFGAQENREYK